MSIIMLLTEVVLWEYDYKKIINCFSKVSSCIC